MARWPSDSSRAVPIDFGRPIQLSSSVVILCMWVGGNSVSQDVQIALLARAEHLLRSSNQRLCSSHLPSGEGEGGIRYVEACDTGAWRAPFEFLQRRFACTRARSYFCDDPFEANGGRRVHALRTTRTGEREFQD